MDNTKDYVVFSQRMAGFLMFHGCKLLKIKNDYRTPAKFVYYFPNTDYVMSQVDNYLQQRNV
jgi:hypothetical protein